MLPHTHSLNGIMDSKSGKIGVVMFPWLAHGHISPFLELAKKLTTRNFHIYFCSTPANLVSIKQKLYPKYSFSIELVELHLPHLPELPPHYHTTNGLPPHLMDTLKAAFDMASAAFSHILKALKPNLLIYDFLQPWAPSLALQQKIPAVEFLCTSATMMSFLNHFLKNPGIKFPFPSIYLHDHEVGDFIYLLESSANNIESKDPVRACGERSSNIVLIKTTGEMEGKYIDYLSFLMDKKIVPVGPLVPEPIKEYGEETKIIKWLNTKERSSVVFVSFGSEYFLSKEDMNEIAYGLELSKVNFIWVVRFPLGGNSKLDEELPDGFVERIGERGMVVEGWAPQIKILENWSIGGFVSHCGWSSVMESIKFGVPIIALPMHLDQPLNARLVEELGVGVEVYRDKNGRIERKELERTIKYVMEEENGEVLRMKTNEFRDKMRNKGDEEIDVVVAELVKLYRKVQIN
ncbi:beta-D-glucosyl crocetin beta-1,6-glucosyltransferase-like [Ziziphus jujuba]|uniref:Glycosyltransferase n=1 Tax=Ziziphus jujuba TaxID=326968 RepID=A0A6P4BPH2_ZIZJJ|nr:beta-D-glucosyl crocetin beta-1,6-glucosyltransferase-like [Ziziphus jujuba]